ncbi:MAG: SMP-30/gluconolactonase/LRE family protein [Acidobacteriota bacterium]
MIPAGTRAGGAMRKIPVGLLTLGLLFPACRQDAGGEPPPAAPSTRAAFPTLGEIERFDPRLDALIPAGAAMEKLAEGFDWAEGPVWLPAEGRLLFSDVPRNVVYSWSEAEGIREFLSPSGYTGTGQWEREPGSNGLALDPSGTLVLCQHGDRRISRWTPDGGFQELVSSYQGRRFNSPNDLVFDRLGTLYFTDPPYGLAGLNQSPLKELDFNGVYRLSVDGELRLLTRELTFPNGIALSPDESTLYVAVSDPERPVVMAYSLGPDGTLAGARVFFDFAGEVSVLPGLPDGLKVDRAGNVYTTGPGGVSILAPDGTRLGRLNTGVATANCGWGEDGSTLFITADSYLLRVRTSARGW